MFKVLMCLPKYECKEGFNSAELARWQSFTRDLVINESRRDTVILKNMRTVAYNGRMGKVVRVEGTRTVVRLLPDGQILNVPTANMSAMKNCVSIMMVNDRASLQGHFLPEDIVLFFDTDAVLKKRAEMRAHGAVYATAPIEAWPGGPHLPTDKLMEFFGLDCDFQDAGPITSRSGLAVLDTPDGHVIMTASNVSDTELRSFWNEVENFQEGVGGAAH